MIKIYHGLITGLDFHPAIDTLPNHPVEHQLFAIVLVKLNQTDVAGHGKRQFRNRSTTAVES